MPINLRHDVRNQLTDTDPTVTEIVTGTDVKCPSRPSEVSNQRKRVHRRDAGVRHLHPPLPPLLPSPRRVLRLPVVTTRQVAPRTRTARALQAVARSRAQARRPSRITRTAKETNTQNVRRRRGSRALMVNMRVSSRRVESQTMETLKQLKSR